MKEISEEHARKFHKINNVEIYKKLGLPSCPIFVLDDVDILSEIISGEIRDDLRSDIEKLCEYSLVIRTDIETDAQAKRQLLPRTCEVRDSQAALKFLKETLENFKQANITEPVAFIFHNFIPAVSSAFAYAARPFALRLEQRHSQTLRLPAQRCGQLIERHDCTVPIFQDVEH
ncbi:hypothetical protein [Burkholderia cepacia]|uniref:hypothetical protein n=1 Tax=Burkholderia cepacia TaxID=292 RepID=UPI0021AB85C8|nr:hypothetical protein [Burkholderia cepacia]